MFLGKLWIRIKGEFLSAREEIVDEPDARKSVKGLLKKFETLFRGEAEKSQRPNDDEDPRELDLGQREESRLEKGYSETITETGTTSQGREEPAERKKQSSAESPSPNPRKLG
jgi:hypothetical protein